MTAIALCAGQATPEDDPWHSDDPEDQAYAKRVCGLCDRRSACLDGALAREEPHGIWGGLAASERAGLLLFADDLLLPAVRDVHGSRTAYMRCTDGEDGRACAECCSANSSYIAERRRVEALAPPKPKRRKKREGQFDLLAEVDVTASERVMA